MWRKNFKKFPKNFFMSEEKLYRIYLKDHCIYSNLSEEDFERTWGMLQHLMDVLDTKVNREELKFEEILTNSTN
jgi:hypothetical protein